METPRDRNGTQTLPEGFAVGPTWCTSSHERDTVLQPQGTMLGLTSSKENYILALWQELWNLSYG